MENSQSINLDTKIILYYFNICRGLDNLTRGRRNLIGTGNVQVFETFESGNAGYLCAIGAGS